MPRDHIEGIEYVKVTSGPLSNPLLPPTATKYMLPESPDVLFSRSIRPPAPENMKTPRLPPQPPA